MTDKVLPEGYTRKIANQIMTADQRAEFEEKLEMNLALMEEGIGRFRVNIFVQRNEVGLVCRHIVSDIPDYKKIRTIRYFARAYDAQKWTYFVCRGNRFR